MLLEALDVFFSSDELVSKLLIAGLGVLVTSSWGVLVLVEDWIDEP